MNLPRFDEWLTTQPAEEQNALTADEPEGCADCGHDPCDCDTRCPDCGQRYQSKAEADAGQCQPCAMDYAEQLRDEVS